MIPVSIAVFAGFILVSFSTQGIQRAPLSSSARIHPADSLDTARAFYVEYCATCHGDNWEGGLAGSLADGRWTYGSTDREISRVIREGIDDEGMPGWKAVLSDDAVRDMIQLIRTMERDRAAR